MHSATAPAAAIDTAQIQQVMLTVVADKTGYPVDMLELSMDMEADLGIDSIKRVEILGAVQDQIANLPELNPEDLAELRTLGQIVDYMQSKAGGAPSTSPTQAAALVAAVAAATASVDTAEFATTLLKVVAEKTGYPVEMLELEMDMEADLGIDSIKRVEILGAAQDAMPGLPEVDAESLAEMRSLQEIVNAFCQTTSSSNAQTTIAKAPSATVVIERLAAPLLAEQKLDGANYLVVSDGTASSHAVVDKLLAAGVKVNVLLPAWVRPSSKKAIAKAANSLSIKDVTEEAVSELISSTGQLDGIITLHNAAAIKGIEYPQASKNGLMLAFLLAKYSGLGKANSTARKSFVVLTRQGGQLGFNEEKADLVQGGLNGLVKTLAEEWSDVFCRVVDIADSFNANETADKLWQELNASDSQTKEVGYDAQGRLTLIASETDSYALESGNSITKDSVFLVSGGAKGVTAHCVMELAMQFQSQFILLGRSPFEAQEPSWAANANDAVALKKAAMEHLLAQGEKATPVTIQQMIKPVLSNREISGTIQAIEAVGGKAHYLAVDVTDSKALQAAVAKVTQTTGAVTGILHGAGVLADRLIEQKTLAEFESVYSTKIDGLSALLSCVDAKSLQHLVLFSSAAGFYGNAAQSDYSIANEILNKTALRFKALHPKAQVLSFNWGPWDGGMVTPELKRMFNDRGVYIIPLDAGAQLLASELAADTNRSPQILVGNSMQGAEQADSTVKKLQSAV